MKKGRASRTAMWVAALRGVAGSDRPAIVRDELAAELLPWPYRGIVRAAEVAPRLSALVMRGAARVTGNLSRHMAMRTRAIDDVVISEAMAGCEQLVLLGAGFDARAWRIEALAKSTVFEIDHPDTQADKRAAIGSHVPRAREVVWAPIDFASATASIEDVLARAGHDRTKRTTFVWEGVTMYLESAAIDATLDAVSRVSAAGSCLLATYHLDAFAWETLPLALVVRAAGEPFRTRLTREDIRTRLEARDFAIERDEGSDDWSRRYLRTPGYRSTERLVIARRRRATYRAKRSQSTPRLQGAKQ